MFIATLGCKVNQYESQQLHEVLTDRRQGANSGTQTAPETLILVNTCAVTGESEAKSRRLVRQLVKRRGPARVVVFGCSVERDPGAFAAIPGVTHVVTARNHGGNRVAAVLDALGVSPTDAQTALAPGLRHFAERHRAYLKVQDGCRQFCAYCLISHLRCELSSVPPDEVLAEARQLLQNGCRELIVAGIHLGYYGLNLRSRAQLMWLPEDRTEVRTTCLADLMSRLAALPCEEPFRLRISSLEAHEASEELLQIMAGNRPEICPHLHLSMQSGSASVLARMRRPGTLEQYVDRCEAARRVLGDVALTTDIIVGFPGETHREFLETCDVVRRLKFAKIHIFPFSPRPGTPAAEMPDQVPGDVKRSRCAYLAELEAECRADFTRRVADLPAQVLVERHHPERGTVSGTSQFFVPVEFPGGPELVGTLVTRLR